MDKAGDEGEGGGGGVAAAAAKQDRRWRMVSSLAAVASEKEEEAAAVADASVGGAKEVQEVVREGLAGGSARCSSNIKTPP